MDRNYSYFSKMSDVSEIVIQLLRKCIVLQELDATDCKPCNSCLVTTISELCVVRSLASYIFGGEFKCEFFFYIPQSISIVFNPFYVVGKIYNSYIKTS